MHPSGKVGTRPTRLGRYTLYGRTIVKRSPVLLSRGGGGVKPTGNTPANGVLRKIEVLFAFIVFTPCETYLQLQLRQLPLCDTKKRIRPLDTPFWRVYQLEKVVRLNSFILHD